MLKDFIYDTTEKNSMKKALYKFLQKEKVASKIDMLKEFKGQAPNTTLRRLINDLEDKGYIRTCGLGEPTGGRPPVLYEVVPEAGYLIGIEIARTHVEVLLVDMEFKVIDQQNFFLTSEHTPKKTVSDIITEAKALLELNGVQEELLIGVGVGSVGPINRERGIILSPEAFSAEGWVDVKIVDMLRHEFDVPIFLENGVNASSLAEYHFHTLNGKNILYCMSGYEIRGSFISNGHMYNNKEGDSHSFGHIITVPNGKPCSCGNNGCLNTYASLGAIFESIKEKQELTNDNNKKKIEKIDELLRSIKDNETLIKEAIMESAYYYGLGLANMINILHPDVVILHGKLIYYFDEYFHEVVHQAREHTFLKTKNTIEIRKSFLGEKAAAMGAALQVFYKL